MRDNSILSSLPRAVFRLLASLKLAVALIVLLAAVLAVATFVEADKGRDYARWYCYTQTWFVALLAMLGVNILSATLVRFPWKLRQFGFLVTHAGLLVLLAGSIVTFDYGIDATISLQEEGEASDHVMIRDLNRFKVQWQPTAGRPDRPVSQFVFPPGPVDWPEGKSLPLGEINSIEAAGDEVPGPRPACGRVDGRPGRQRRRGAEVLARRSGQHGQRRTVAHRHAASAAVRPSVRRRWNSGRPKPTRWSTTSSIPRRKKTSIRRAC